MAICNLFVATGIPTISPQSRSFLTCSPKQTRRRAENKSLIIHACELDGHSELHVGGGNGSDCGGGGGLYTPLQLKTQAGKYLSEFVQQPDSKMFSAAVEDQLRRLSDNRNKAAQLMDSSISNRPEGELYKKIAERMIQETKVEVEETMYMLICRRFFKAGVHMLPRISDCLVQGRLVLSSSIYSHGQLERILRPEALELVRRHVARVTRLDADSNINDYPELTQMHHDYIPLAYDCQLMNGHFFRSASFRYDLEKIFAKSIDSKRPYGGIKAKAKRVGTFKSYTRLYPSDFHTKLCAPTSNEAVNMMNKHLEALFSQFKASFSATKGLVMTSPGSIWRLALEGFAFGTFLWDAEYFVSKFYELDDDYEGLSYP